MKRDKWYWRTVGACIGFTVAGLVILALSVAGLMHWSAP